MLFYYKVLIFEILKLKESKFHRMAEIFFFA